MDAENPSRTANHHSSPPYAADPDVARLSNTQSQRNITMRAFVILSVFASLSALPAVAQQNDAAYSFNSGIKLRGNYHINQSTASDKQENGFGAGLEIVGNHIGIGLYGFTQGKTSEFDKETSVVSAVLEANYFYPIERLRLAPYAGVHTGLGQFTSEYFDDPFFPKPQDSFKDLGYQVGLRFKPIPVIGLDVQWRRSSASLVSWQDENGGENPLERNQFLVGITLF
jgi:hypothetical protein